MQGATQINQEFCLGLIRELKTMMKKNGSLFEQGVQGKPDGHYLGFWRDSRPAQASWVSWM